MSERITDAKIKFYFSDITADLDANPSVSDIATWNTNAGEQLKKRDGQAAAYATFELNQMPLGKRDGNWDIWGITGPYKLLPETIPETLFTGWWSNVISNASGDFQTKPVLTVTFTNNHSSAGITLRFCEESNEFASQMYIRWYRGNTLLRSKTCYPNAPVYYIEQSVQNYNKVVIRFDKTNFPKHRLKLSEIIYGSVEIIDSTRLISAEVLEEVDISGVTVPIGTLSFKFIDTQNRFSILNGAYNAFQKKQKFKVFCTVDDNESEIGIYYLNEPGTTEDTVVQIDCVDAFGILEQTEFAGDFYSAETVLKVVGDIMLCAGISDYAVDGSIASVEVGGWIPRCSARDALRQVLLASGAIARCKRDGSISIEPVPTSSNGTIPIASKIEGHSLKLQSEINRVVVTVHNYKPQTGEAKVLFEKNLDVGTHVIKFNEPIYWPECRGGTIVEESANYVIVSVSASQIVTVEGYGYNNEPSLHEYSGSTLSGFDSSAELSEEMTLICRDPQAVAERLYNYYQNRVVGAGRIISALEETGNKINLAVSDTKNLEGYLVSQNIDLIGGIISEIKMVGVIE